jgi:hypothetical protein
MKKICITAAMVLLMALSAVSAHADLDLFLSDLNVQAKAGITDFEVKLSTQFGVPLPQVRTVIKTVAFPADAFMCLHLSLLTNRPLEAVLQTYNTNQGKGWGVIAKELGIKPGSDEFHALKRGDFIFDGKPAKHPEKKPGKEKGKDKGEGKGDDNGQGQNKSKGKGQKK